MTCQEAEAYFHSFRRFKKVPGLSPIRALLAKLGHPEEGLRFLHVAGTNGKGSVCAMCASALREAGYRTGLFISPFVINFRERMQVDGRMIGEEELASLVQGVRPAMEELLAEGVSLSEFEAVTAAGLVWFARQQCDVVCLEVGLGGRFDATNVIPRSLVSVIASIGLDHTDILGDTLEKIAFEKCGILRRGGVTVCGPGQEPEALAVIMERCAQEENRLVIPGAASAQVQESGVLGSRVQYGGLELTIPLGGRHQISNCLTAVEALKVLRTEGFVISDKNITDGIKNVRFPARMECFSRRPLVILDGAHNPDGCRALAAALEEFPRERVSVIMGMLADKDTAGSTALVAARAGRFWAVTPPGPRALPAGELAVLARAYCPQTAAADSLGSALEQALKAAGEEDAVFICGSLYLAAEIRPLLQSRFPALQDTTK
ncbi:MAG: bifunctional folylpolyglutamate synthase/dihydrofolate synthase [Oscillospiraceae bacterium]|nr:bifunctional folylpolyglutamate synthase/dihydrofolate synthase [Oscillospiraceae bacterium]